MNIEARSCEDRKRFVDEFQHLKAEWCWLFLFGALLVLCGMAAILFPIVTTAISIKILGIVLMVAGVSTVLTSFWTGRSSGFLVHLLVGILYLVVGMAITEDPFFMPGLALTLFLATWFIVAGSFRAIAALVLRFPYWGWAMFNGIVTLLLGVIIYHDFPNSGIWVIGLLIGIEMLLHGWTWMALSLAVRRIPAPPAAQ
ncbi:MAG: HdeD family acid-resistance protein [Thermoguttaceae bacterium]